jgi:hypothetical protein
MNLTDVDFKMLSCKPFNDMACDLQLMLSRQLAHEPYVIRHARLEQTLEAPLDVWNNLSLTWECGWGTGVSLDINFHVEHHTYTGTVELDGSEVEVTDKHCLAVKLMVTTNWSSTNRNMSSAAAALQLYTRAVQLGQLIEARFADSYFMWKK